MKVYVDQLLILNLYISFFLLLTTEKLMYRQIGFWRRMCAGTISSLFSLYIFLPEINFLFSALVRLAMSAVIVGIDLGIKSLKSYLKGIFIFWLANFAFAGIMYGMWQIFLPDNLAINNSFVYLSVSPLMLIILTVVSYLIISLYRKITGKNKPEELYYDVVFSYKKNCVTLKAYLDTGNFLHDVFSDKQVVVISYADASKLLPADVLPAFESISDKVPNVEGYRVVPFSSVGINGLLPAFSAECRLKNKPDAKPIKIIIAVNKSNLSDQYQALIGINLIQQMEEQL